MIHVTFQKPTLARYWALFLRGNLSVPRRFQYGRMRPLPLPQQRGLSVLRRLQYERMERVALAGTVLDFGGGDRVHYADQVSRWIAVGRTVEYHSANIDHAVQPMFLLRTGQPFPIDDASFDAILSLNTLEHIFELDQTLTEFRRVLKPGGRLVLSMPFMFRVHGHPDDYHRGTPHFWRRKLSEVGFEEIAIDALVWGPFSNGHCASGLPGPLKPARRHAGLLLDILWAACRNRGRTYVVGRQDDGLLASAIGHFIEARKVPETASSAGA